MTIVTVDDLKAHMGLLEDEETDDFLAGKIAAAEDWVAGYIGHSLADLDPLPPAVKEAVLRGAAALCENREATTSNTMLDLGGVTDLLTPVRKWVF